MFFLVHSFFLFCFFFEILDRYSFYTYKTSPFQNSYQWPHLCITYLHFPQSLWCMDACSEYKITTRKCRVSVDALCGQSSKGAHRKTTVISFSSDFLLGKRNLQIVKWQIPPTVSADDAGRLLRVQSGGVRGRRRDLWSGPLRLSHWRSRRTGGSGVSARCRMTPYCHLSTRGKERTSMCDVMELVVH